MVDCLWNRISQWIDQFGEWWDPNSAAKRARHGAFRRKFFDDTKPCNASEVLFIQLDMCLAPPIPPAKPLPNVTEVLTNTTEELTNATDGTTNSGIDFLSGIGVYSLSIGILMLLGVSMAYLIIRRLRRSPSNARVVRQLTNEENIDRMVTTVTILVVGANQTGKQSVIKAFNEIYPESQAWNFITQDFSEHRIPISPKPDLIWLIVNYQASIHDNEFKILRNVGKIPVILIINKVDLLQEINVSDDDAIRNFDKQVPQCLANCDRLMGIRERLLRFDKQILILSLRHEENDDRVLGMNNLIKITNDWLLGQTLESHSQNLLDYNAVNHELKAIRDDTRMQNGSIRVLLIGYSSTGKSSLINQLAGTTVALISFDGSPTTQSIKEYFLPDLDLILMDSMGLEKKRDNTKKLERLRQCSPPDFIWFLVNYQSSIEDDELNLINELFPSIPTIIVVNFMDMLQTLDYDVDFETDTQQINRQYQIERQRLLQFKQSQTNVRRIITISLRSEEQDDSPRGIKLLYEETMKNFLKDTSA